MDPGPFQGHGAFSWRTTWTLLPSNPCSMDDGKYFPSLEMNISVAVKVTYEDRIPAHLRVYDTYAGPSHT